MVRRLRRAGRTAVSPATPRGVPAVFAALVHTRCHEHTARGKCSHTPGGGVFTLLLPHPGSQRRRHLNASSMDTPAHPQRATHRPSTRATQAPSESTPPCPRPGPRLTAPTPTAPPGRSAAARLCGCEQRLFTPRAVSRSAVFTPRAAPSLAPSPAPSPALEQSDVAELAWRIRAIMAQHAEDCKRMTPHYAARYAKRSLDALQAAGPPAPDRPRIPSAASCPVQPQARAVVTLPRRHAVAFFCAGRVDRLAGAVRRSADPGARRREDAGGGGGACGRRRRRSLRAAAPLPLRSRAVPGRQLAAPPHANLAGRGRRDADESGVRCGTLCGMGGARAVGAVARRSIS